MISNGSESEKKDKQDAVAKVIVQSFRRLKESP
jgi:hypothetical protein